jgi:hypothetical protein
MDGIRVLLVLGAVLLPETFAQDRAQVSTCPPLVEKPAYPRLARAAGVYGVVKADFQVSQDGRVLNPVLEGNGLLTKEIESVLSRAQFDSQCSGKIELVYKFVLAGEEDPEGQTTVAFNLPNEYGSDVESVLAQSAVFRKPNSAGDLGLGDCLLDISPSTRVAQVAGLCPRYASRNNGQ